MHTKLALSFAALLMSGVVGHAHAQAEADRPAPPASRTTPATKPATLSQSQALGLLSTINQAEIGAGHLAASRASGSGTKQYAQLMIKEHTENDAKLKPWKPDVSSPAAKAKAAEAKTEAARLSTLNGSAFDMAYLKSMVADHRKALQTLDTQVIPAATDPAVAAFLKDTRVHVAAHLNQAEALHSNAGKANPDGSR